MGEFLIVTLKLPHLLKFWLFYWNSHAWSKSPMFSILPILWGAVFMCLPFPLFLFPPAGSLTSTFNLYLLFWVSKCISYHYPRSLLCLPYLTLECSVSKEGLERLWYQRYCFITGSFLIVAWLISNYYIKHLNTTKHVSLLCSLTTHFSNITKTPPEPLL